MAEAVMTRYFAERDAAEAREQARAEAAEKAKRLLGQYRGEG